MPLRFRDVDNHDVDNRDVIKLALKTGSREVARARRDSLSEADEQLWASLATYDAPTKSGAAHRRYRAFAQGFIFTPVEELAQGGDPRLRHASEKRMREAGLDHGLR